MPGYNIDENIHLIKLEIARLEGSIRMLENFKKNGVEFIEIPVKNQVLLQEKEVQDVQG